MRAALSRHRVCVLRFKGERRPQLDRLVPYWELESGGHHAPNGIIHAVERERSSQNVRVGVELLLPHRLTEHDYKATIAGFVFFGQKGSTENGCRAQQSKQVGRHDRSLKSHSILPSGHYVAAVMK